MPSEPTSPVVPVPSARLSSNLCGARTRHPLASAGGLREAGRANRRMAGVDFVRVLAVLAVIIIHFRPFLRSTGAAGQALGGLVNQTARFGVPFFLTAAGYFFRGRLRGGANVWRTLRRYAIRLLTPFAAWSAAYVAIPNAPHEFARIREYGYLRHIYWTALTLAADPLRLVLEGTSEHLWFLISLLTGLALAVVAWELAGRKGLCGTAVALYLFGLLAGSYAATPAGIALALNTRDGPFHSTLFIALGWLLADAGRLPRPRVAGAVAAAGLAAHLGEALLLRRLFGVPLESHNFLAGTILYGGGIFALALSWNRIAERNLIARFGRLTMGVYLIHPFLCVYTSRAFGGPGGWWRELAGPVLVYGASLGAAFVLSRYPPLRRLVA